MRHPKKIGLDLRRYMKRRGLTEFELAQRVSAGNAELTLTQSWVSRVARGKFRRPTGRIRALAAYANIPVFEGTSVNASGRKLILKAVQSSWNGSLGHAAMIAKLIAATRDFDGEQS
jgi:transcriptional regulator with XRE-family HTH domain